MTIDDQNNEYEIDLHITNYYVTNILCAKRPHLSSDNC